MVEMRSNCFLLGLVLIFLSLTDSLARAHKAKEEIAIVVVKGGNASLAAGGPEKENFDVVRNAAGANSGKLVGRKMMEKVVMGKEKTEEAMEGLSPKNSGRTVNVQKNPLEASDELTNYQMDASMFKPKPVLDSEYLGTSGKGAVDHHKTNLAETQESTTAGIVNLMNKDYSGDIFDNRPRHNPINNFEPLAHKNKAP